VYRRKDHALATAVWAA